ncbi:MULTISPECIES: hypothetical protein [Enterobacteriaceae]|uniref:hypothetical protein n=1 Tax=Enterobacteriaceae TaxID=543 RepID=UPI0011570411|nr:hypothetical protein [Klebsiella pasteurii]EKW5058928.1 hypothetical protein [Citrobacter amalonaticus]VUT11891.1 hypothetical protein SB6416_03213 [Klebsiella pasteurii]
MEKIIPTVVQFIKLGEAGEWERQCLSDGTLRFGYNQTPNSLCIEERWEDVHDIWLNIRDRRQAVATSDVRQIKTFYTAGAETVFITFWGGFLYWCRPIGQVEVLEDGSRLRKTVEGWKNTSIGGAQLTTDHLSGDLLRVQGYRGTICNVSAHDYVVRKINDEDLSAVSAAKKAEEAYLIAIKNLCQLLTWQDFELLIDLIFSTSGWRRTSIVGKTQKTLDLELELPTTGEKAFVQIKSYANAGTLSEYEKRFRETTAYKRMFFIWHSGPLSESIKADCITLIGPDKLAGLILDSGLTRWLRKKVS